MTTKSPITTLFLDIGGVLLTNGWDRQARAQAAETFHVDFKEMDERHHLTFDTYEEGKLSLKEYLERVIFFEKRSFSVDEFRDFMFSRSQPYQGMIKLIHSLKTRHGIKTVAVSNEGRELTRYRIQTFKLDEVIDTFVSSCFVHFRKPDLDIFRMALDISQAAPEQVAYIDDRSLFVEVAKELGIHGIHHTNYQTTQKSLADMGLQLVD
ncbi:MAG TPA: HAD family phosphatase [Anaerolineales bacterium]|nr:HAD family phosphatase [Anaerolineales bacterium]